MQQKTQVMHCTGDTSWKEVSPSGLTLTSWVDAYVNVILKAMLDQHQVTEETTGTRTRPGTPTPDDSCVKRFVGWIVAQAEAAILAQEEEFVSDLVERSLENICKEVREDPNRREDRLDVLDTTTAFQVIEKRNNGKRNVGMNYRKDDGVEIPTEDNLDKFTSEFVFGVIDNITKEQVRDSYSAKRLDDGNMLNVFVAEIVADALDRAKQGKETAQETTQYKHDTLDVFAAEFVWNILTNIYRDKQVVKNTHIHKEVAEGNTGTITHSNPVHTSEKPLTPTCKNSAVSEAFQRIKHPSKDRPVDADFSYVYHRLTNSFGEEVDDSVISFVMQAIPQHSTWSEYFEAVDKSIRSVENSKKKHPTLHRCKAMTPEQLKPPSSKPPVKCFLDIFQMKKSGRSATPESVIQPSAGVVTPSKNTGSSRHNTPSRTRRFLASMRNSLFRLGISTTLSRRGHKRMFV